MTRWALCLIALSACSANAEEVARRRWWLDLNLSSYHSREGYFFRGDYHTYNSRNFGIGVTYDYRSWCSIKGGWFENSYDKTSVYALINPYYDFLKSADWRIAIGVGVGAVTGYHDTVDALPPISPMGILTLTVADERRWHVSIGFIPFRELLGSDHADVLTLQVGWKL